MRSIYKNDMILEKINRLFYLLTIIGEGGGQLIAEL